jgi:hypothetical protein
VDEAFQLLTNRRPYSDAKGAKQKIVYLETLRNIYKKFSDTGVVLCAAGLGSSAITNIKEEEWVFLLFKLGEKWDDLELDEIKKIADGIN